MKIENVGCGQRSACLIYGKDLRQFQLLCDLRISFYQHFFKSRYHHFTYLYIKIVRFVVELIRIVNDTINFIQWRNPKSKKNIITSIS